MTTSEALPTPACFENRYETDGVTLLSHYYVLFHHHHHHHHHHHYHHHLSLNREGRWGTTDEFATSFLHFSLFSTALWDLPKSRPVHSLMSSYLFFCLPCLRPPALCLARWFLPDLMNGRHVHTSAVCVSLRCSILRVVRLPVGSWHGLPRW